ncbi:hypothetical protein ACH10C_004750 [Escherichia coli]|nr:hypothetical protein [Escherichia coli]
MHENAARACWQKRLNYQNCVIWSCAPSVFSAGAAGASCSGWRADCKPECPEINILRHSRRFFKCAYKALLPAAP